MEREVITLLTAALPVSELRGAIPLAILVFKFSATKAFFIAVVGNMIFIIPFLFFLRKFSDNLMRRWYFYNRFMNWIFERARRKHLDHFHQWKWTQLALVVFVAVPLPLTGAWSGAVAAYILDIPFWRSIFSIFLGVVISGVIVASLTSLGFFAMNSFN